MDDILDQIKEEELDEVIQDEELLEETFDTLSINKIEIEEMDMDFYEKQYANASEIAIDKDTNVTDNYCETEDFLLFKKPVVILTKLEHMELKSIDSNIVLNCIYDKHGFTLNTRNDDLVRDDNRTIMDVYDSVKHNCVRGDLFERPESPVYTMTPSAPTLGFYKSRHNIKLLGECKKATICLKDFRKGSCFGSPSIKNTKTIETKPIKNTPTVKKINPMLSKFLTSSKASDEKATIYLEPNEEKCEKKSFLIQSARLYSNKKRTISRSDSREEPWSISSSYLIKVNTSQMIGKNVEMQTYEISNGEIVNYQYCRGRNLKKLNNFNSTNPYDKHFCCWYSKENFLNDMVKNNVIRSSEIYFLKSIHACTPLRCSCCCQNIRNIVITPKESKHEHERDLNLKLPITSKAVNPCRAAANADTFRKQINKPTGKLVQLEKRTPPRQLVRMPQLYLRSPPPQAVTMSVAQPKAKKVKTLPVKTAKDREQDKHNIGEATDDQNIRKDNKVNNEYTSSYKKYTDCLFELHNFLNNGTIPEKICTKRCVRKKKNVDSKRTLAIKNLTNILSKNIVGFKCITKYSGQVGVCSKYPLTKMTDKQIKNLRKYLRLRSKNVTKNPLKTPNNQCMTASNTSIQQTNQLDTAQSTILVKNISELIEPTKVIMPLMTPTLRLNLQAQPRFDAPVNAPIPLWPETASQGPRTYINPARGRAAGPVASPATIINMQNRPLVGLTTKNPGGSAVKGPDSVPKSIVTVNMDDLLTQTIVRSLESSDTKMHNPNAPRFLPMAPTLSNNCNASEVEHDNVNVNDLVNQTIVRSIQNREPAMNTASDACVIDKNKMLCNLLNTSSHSPSTNKVQFYPSIIVANKFRPPKLVPKTTVKAIEIGLGPKHRLSASCTTPGKRRYRTGNERATKERKVTEKETKMYKYNPSSIVVIDDSDDDSNKTCDLVKSKAVTKLQTYKSNDNFMLPNFEEKEEKDKQDKEEKERMRLMNKRRKIPNILTRKAKERLDKNTPNVLAPSVTNQEGTSENNTVYHNVANLGLLTPVSYSNVPIVYTIIGNQDLPDGFEYIGSLNSGLPTNTEELGDQSITLNSILDDIDEISNDDD